MAAAKNTTRTNTPTEQNKADNDLVLYRLQQVENKVDNIGKKLDGQENIKKADLIEFRESIVQTVREVRADIDKDMAGLQKQIDNKANAQDVKDLKTLVKSGGAFITTIIGAIIIYYLTTGRM